MPREAQMKVAPFSSAKMNTISYPTLTCGSGMGEPEVLGRSTGGGGGGGGGETGTGGSVAGRTRKRILDPLEAQEDDSTARRLGVFTDWQDTIKGIGVPNKKGYMDGGHQRPWESEDIDQGLAADLDDSLSGLGVDISTVGNQHCHHPDYCCGPYHHHQHHHLSSPAVHHVEKASYNMSEALLALPTVQQFKEEGNSSNQDKQSVTSSTPATFDESSQTNTTDRLFKLLSSDSISDCQQPTIHQLLQQHLGSNTSHLQGSNATNTSSMAGHHLGSVAVSSGLEVVHDGVTMSPQPMAYEDNRFQYILGAATSVATKVNEESLSYLNQGQSYEIKVKKLGDLTSCRGKLYHSVIRVCFHERRLQYMERQQLDSWRQMRPGERILEVDIPLSYGIFDVKQESGNLNTCEFDWDPTKEVGVYIKVNCISTEFTPKKHGGEKGVPFRIQVETYSQTSSGMERLYVCACQIKVFKLKGADRKHKQDREKIMKRSPSEQEKYQPSCECTILTELSPEVVYVPVPESSSPVMAATSGVMGLSVRGNSPPIDMKSEASSVDTPKCVENGLQHQQIGAFEGDEDMCSPFFGVPLHSGSSTAHTSAWLMANRFNRYHKMFANFTGTDILRLSRSDLIEMCGIADGLRLFYALHANQQTHTFLPRKVTPRLTVYVCMEHEQLYHAVYLENLSCQEFTQKLCTLLHISIDRIHDVYLQGPSGIHILVTDEVVQNMAEETTLSIEVLQDSARERYRLLIRVINNKTNTSTSPGPQS
ncbi:transcription factor CP2-like isoform X3 [Eriocheir sinensis]|uniref:transcription factor CP2-like isoform X3 n=1 Tax=Eriocheir sinensis TaxID=95602 RepID=UPI0021CA6587|nr:transcription factor CP2-like isoform X3 [Eriocheir sinensis]